MEEKKRQPEYKVKVADYKWVNSSGQSGRWRGPSWRDTDVPSGPRLQWGSRVGASADPRSKGVFFGAPGLPRLTFATTKVQPSLGPAMGVPKAFPPRVSEAFPPECGTHMDEQPAAFVLEGVFGFNPNRAREILKLRAQLAQCEHEYAENDAVLRAGLKGAKQHHDDLHHLLYAEDIRRRDQEQKKQDLAKELQQLRVMVDEQTSEIRTKKKEIARQRRQEMASKGGAAQ
uniref:Uncharacterized protein n=1 Tax=Hemiselmis tepida TaxID=464990 RepID=A0A7S0YH42_9CRYP|mmetsp:Transcript_10293/g.26662  ORF Transcript_10293/g.26662 Transcript_10293/m.26662 type:complete len:230 (+) Transcript_10293:94-783(+)|eukprot:CAMPEP_0174931930 /NCGR_PEP_ID=MMETSP1355-20121228/35437_1 /TAXON_ID=464990 /ORGANISM="Hemiselmis tepida, Strain CCMP443" /LENGTH=229 /DNA_ID=CAMNT_0016178325 /DNA_START=94 /DNA_END=783 /DNA_ORIENTATION=+